MINILIDYIFLSPKFFHVQSQNQDSELRCFFRKLHKQKSEYDAVVYRLAIHTHHTYIIMIFDASHHRMVSIHKSCGMELIFVYIENASLISKAQWKISNHSEKHIFVVRVTVEHGIIPINDIMKTDINIFLCCFVKLIGFCLRNETKKLGRTQMLL